MINEIVVEERTIKDFQLTEHKCPICGYNMFTEAFTEGINAGKTVIWCGYNIPQADGLHCREVTAYGKDLKQALEKLFDKFESVAEIRKQAVKLKKQ